jgi:hypothetical protein
VSSIQAETWPNTNLPYTGERPYVSPDPLGPIKVRGGGGFLDIDGNRWERDKSGHGGPHWDVQHRNGTHTNVDYRGRVRGGPKHDNFPNVPRYNAQPPPWRKKDAGDNDDEDE